MKDKIKNLIDLKSIITLFLVFSLILMIFLSVKIEDDAIKGLFISITSACFTYFFTKKKGEENGKV